MKKLPSVFSTLNEKSPLERECYGIGKQKCLILKKCSNKKPPEVLRVNGSLNVIDKRFYPQGDYIAYNL